MSIEIQNLNESERKVSIQMEKEETQKYFEEILKKEAKKLTIPGFRKGKAPLSLVKKMYGDALFYDNLDKIAENKFWDEIDLQGIEVFGVPKLTDINLDENGGLKFEIEFEVLPQIEITDFDGIEVEKEEYEISDKFYEDIVEYVRFQLRTEEPAEIIDSMDYIVELEIFNGNNTSEKESAQEPKKYSLYLKNLELNQEFVNLLLNKKLNEEFETSIPILNNDIEKQTSKDADQIKKYKIVTIKKVILPEANDELAKKFTNDQLKTLEELKQQFAQRELEYRKAEAYQKLKDEIRKALISKYNFHPPTSLIERAAKYYSEDIKKKYNVNQLPEETLKTINEYASNDAKWYIIKKSIKDKFNLDLSEQEVIEYAQSLAEKFNINQEAVLKFLYSDKSTLLDEKADEKFFNFILDKIKVNTRKVII